MYIQQIEIACPKCQNKFEESILLSLSSTHYEIAKDSDLLLPYRVCPKCKEKINLNNNPSSWKKIERRLSKKEKIKRWIGKFLP